MMKNLITYFFGTLSIIHLLGGLYLLFNNPNQKLFFIVFFVGLFYTSLFLYTEKINAKN